MSSQSEWGKSETKGDFLPLILIGSGLAIAIFLYDLAVAVLDKIFG